jgi:hypothetical protein
LLASIPPSLFVCSSVSVGAEAVYCQFVRRFVAFDFRGRVVDVRSSTWRGWLWSCICSVPSVYGLVQARRLPCFVCGLFQRRHFLVLYGPFQPKGTSIADPHNESESCSSLANSQCSATTKSVWQKKNFFFV